MMRSFIEKGNNRADIQAAAGCHLKKSVPLYAWKCWEECSIFEEALLVGNNSQSCKFQIEDKMDGICRRVWRTEYRKNLKLGNSKFPWSQSPSVMTWSKPNINNNEMDWNREPKNRHAAENRWKLNGNALRTNEIMHTRSQIVSENEREKVDFYGKQNQDMFNAGFKTRAQKDRYCRQLNKKKRKEFKKKFKETPDCLMKDIPEDLVHSEWQKTINEIEEELKKKFKISEDELSKLGDQKVIDLWAEKRANAETMNYMSQTKKEKAFLKRKARQRLKYSSKFCDVCLKSPSSINVNATEDYLHIFCQCPLTENLRIELDSKVEALGHKFKIEIFPPHRNRNWNEDKKSLKGRPDPEYEMLWSFQGAFPKTLKTDLLAHFQKLYKKKKRKLSESKTKEILIALNDLYAIYSALIYRERVKSKENIWRKKKSRLFAVSSNVPIEENVPQEEEEMPPD